jgi:hypothetical protein
VQYDERKGFKEVEDRGSSSVGVSVSVSVSVSQYICLTVFISTCQYIFVSVLLSVCVCVCVCVTCNVSNSCPLAPTMKVREPFSAPATPPLHSNRRNRRSDRTEQNRTE